MAPYREFLGKREYTCNSLAVQPCPPVRTCTGRHAAIGVRLPKGVSVAVRRRTGGGGGRKVL